jgi:hypothetical protein
MFVLILVLLNSSGGAISSNEIRFSSESSCLKAINKLVQLERGFTVKATCVKDE